MGLYARGAVYAGGPGAWFLTGGDGGTVFHPSIGIDMRRVQPITPQVGLESVINITIHDFEYIGHAYEWLFSDEVRGALSGTFFPFLLFVPLIGSHATAGFGLIGYTSPTLPSVYFDAGVAVSAYLRPSDHKLVFGLASYFGVGVEVSDTVGAGIRLIWGPPRYRSWFSDAEGHVISVMATYNLQ